MIRTLAIFLLMLAAEHLYGQQNSWMQRLSRHRDSLNAVFADPQHSILDENKLLFFRELAFFPPDATWIVEAKVKKVKNASPFLMKTSKAHRNPEYVAVYRLDFKRDGRKYHLFAYRNIELSKKAEFADYLFVPFTDESSGKESYGGGRYLDLDLRDIAGKYIKLDFNYCYNPYCAYNDNYACPIPPRENYLNIAVIAGAAYDTALN